MNTNSLSARPESGNVLLLTIIFGAVVGVVLLGYLRLIQATTTVRARSLAWNQAIPVLESGIEEALTHLQDDAGNLSTNRWTKNGLGSGATYSRTQTNSDGTYYAVTVSNANSSPISIYSQGFVAAPLGTGYISRLVQVNLTNSMQFGKAIAAKGKIDLNGQTIVDAYDSTDPTYSTGGSYDPAKRKDGADVVTNSGQNPAVDAGNGHIYGKVSTGAGGTVATSSGGTVGDLSWSAGNTGIEPGFTGNDMNASYPNVISPAGYNSWLALAKTSPLGIIGGVLGGLFGGTNYDYVVSGNVTAYGGLTMNSGDNLVVVGNSTLYVAGDLSMGGNSYIYIAPGATLRLYVGGVNATITGGGFVNGTGNAANFAYLGTTNNTSLKYSGGADFIGTINAPQADVTVSGGANVYGAAIVNTYTSKSSKAAFHYDQALGIPGILKLVSYREL